MQCYHCQKLGHISTQCPDKDDGPTCMYCAESHPSKQCPSKGDKKSHKCANCLHSNRKNANTHNSVSSKCPTIERECKKIDDGANRLKCFIYNAQSICNKTNGVIEFLYEKNL